MPDESQVVAIRTSVSADGWWTKHVDAKLNDSFRVVRNARDYSHPPLFTDNELKDLPFRRQRVPAHVGTLSWSGSHPSVPPYSGIFPRNVISSTEVTRRVLAKEITEMEHSQEQTRKQHVNDIANLRGKVSSVLKINKALAVYHASHF